MLLLNCFIKINNPDTKTDVFFNYVNEIEVVTSVHNFTDTAKIVVPRKLKYKGKSIIDYVKRNNTISISIGYGDTFSLETVFQGYVKSVSTGTPIVIECENEAWKLKKIMLPAKYYAQLSMKDFIKEWMPGYNYKAADVNLGETRIAKDTPLSQVFEYFTSNFPVNFYFRENTFYGVLPGAMAFMNDQVKTVKFRMGWNTINDNLVYTLAEDVKLQIIAKAVTRENKKYEYKWPVVGGDGFEVRTFLVPGASSMKQLEDYAKNMQKTFKVDNMKGDLTTFGIPFIRKADIAHILDDDCKERDDKKFFVDAVTYTFGQGGYRQKITLGGQIHE